MTVTKNTPSGNEKFVLRLPSGMRERICESAKNNQRSMNAEVVYRIDHSLEQEAEIVRLKAMIDRLLQGPAEHLNDLHKGA